MPCSRLDGEDHSLSVLPGLGSAGRAKLNDLDIRGTLDLLASCSTERSLLGLHRATGLGCARLREWRARADLLRIAGVTSTGVRLLRAAGIESAYDLGRRRHEQVASRLSDLCHLESPGAVPPSPLQVQEWIARACGERVEEQILI